MYDNRDKMDIFYSERQAEEQARAAMYIARVMGWMCLGLLTTFVSAFMCIAVPAVMRFVFAGNGMLVVFAAQIIVVMVLSMAIEKLSPSAATVLFMGYSALTGLTVSVIAAVYDLGSILLALSVSSAVFLAMSVYGFITRKDLTGVGRLAVFGLFGILIGALVNMFLRSTMTDLLITCVGVVVFVALTAYDTQKIKAIYQRVTAEGDGDYSDRVRKLSIYGALTLYLDFINIFLMLLRLLGRRRD